MNLLQKIRVVFTEEASMPSDEQSDKQEGPVENIKESASKIGASAGEAVSQTWNKVTGGGKKRSSGRGHKKTSGSTMKGGRKGRTTSGHRTSTSATRSAAAKKTARTRARNRAGR
jgi:hypothetical protein